LIKTDWALGTVTGEPKEWYQASHRNGCVRTVWNQNARCMKSKCKPFAWCVQGTYTERASRSHVAFLRLARSVPSTPFLFA